MKRRQFLTVGTGILALLAGCTGSSDSNDGGSQATDDPTTTDTSTPTATETQTATDTPTETPTDTSTPTDTPTANYQVRIKYDGEWQGTVGGDGSTRSVDGAGTETFDVQGDPFIVSANAQKMDQGSGILTIQILKDGEVIAQQTTSAQYGLAQVTSEDGIQTASSDDSRSSSQDSGSSQTTFKVRIQYSGEWQGSIASGGSAKSIDGTGDKTITIDGEPSIISANAQKKADNSNKLTIQILKDGEVVKESSTTASYGIAQVSYSNY